MSTIFAITVRSRNCFYTYSHYAIFELIGSLSDSAMIFGTLEYTGAHMRQLKLPVILIVAHTACGLHQRLLWIIRRFILSPCINESVARMLLHSWTCWNICPPCKTAVRVCAVYSESDSRILCDGGNAFKWQIQLKQRSQHYPSHDVWDGPITACNCSSFRLSHVELRRQVVTPVEWPIRWPQLSVKTKVPFPISSMIVRSICLIRTMDCLSSSVVVPTCVCRAKGSQSIWRYHSMRTVLFLIFLCYLWLLPVAWKFATRRVGPEQFSKVVPRHQKDRQPSRYFSCWKAICWATLIGVRVFRW